MTFSWQISAGIEGIVRQLEVPEQSHTVALVAHRPIVSDFDILDLRDRKHARDLFSRMASFRLSRRSLEVSCFLDVLCKAALHERLRGLAGTITGNLCLALKIARDIRPLLGDF
mgnify:CR=1 FL=1